MIPHSCEDLGYRADAAWARPPAGWGWPEVAAVATDSRDRVYVFNRGEHPVMVFDRDGTFLASWGEGLFVRPHGIFIGPDDAVYCSDDRDHTVRKFTPQGRLLLTLGGRGQPSDAVGLIGRAAVGVGRPGDEQVAGGGDGLGQVDTQI